ncbi:hypothetical protein FRB96_005361 [Tulasnella sp. 330]|nr:hypothetical protein FRB96_005361 [Tulasnella sp. 330]
MPTVEQPSLDPLERASLLLPADTDSVGQQLAGKNIASDRRALLDITTNSLLTACIWANTSAAGKRGELRSQKKYSKPVFARLPLELVTQIFWLAARCNACDYIPRLHILANVCKTWAEIIKATPSLWPIVSSQRPIFEWIAALRLSGSCPIVLLQRDDSTRAREGFWSAAVKHAHRWKVAHVRAEDAKCLSALETVSAPLLRTLQLEARRPDLGARPLVGAQAETQLPGRANTSHPALVSSLFRGGAPQLTHVELRNVAIKSWKSSVLSGLRILEIKDVASHGPSVQQIFDVLGACPDLEQLSLHNIIIIGDTPSESEQYETIQLLRLNRISLVRLAATVVSQILSTVLAPSCTNVHIRGTRSERTFATGGNTIHHITSFIVPLFTTALAADKVAASIAVATDPCSLTIEYQSNHLIVFEDIASIAEYLRLVEALVAAHPGRSTVHIEEVCLDVEDHSQQGGVDLTDQLIAFVQHLPNISSLRVFGGELDGLWKAMSTATMGVEGGWLCPNLHSLRIEDYYTPRDPEAFVRMIEKRARAATLRRVTGRQSDGPVVLEQLGMGRGNKILTSSICQRIKRVLGDAFVREA